jgi:hypothetical protein
LVNSRLFDFEKMVNRVVDISYLTDFNLILNENDSLDIITYKKDIKDSVN